MEKQHEFEKSDILDARQVSEIYFKKAISYKAILKMSQEGKLPCLHIGRRYKYRVSDLDEWCERNFKTPVWKKIS